MKKFILLLGLLFSLAFVQAEKVVLVDTDVGIHYVQDINQASAITFDVIAYQAVLETNKQLNIESVEKDFMLSDEIDTFVMKESPIHAVLSITKDPLVLRNTNLDKQKLINSSFTKQTDFGTLNKISTHRLILLRKKQYCNSVNVHIGTINRFV